MDFKEYSELFHTAFNKRPNRIPTTRPTAPKEILPIKGSSEDYALCNTFYVIYNNKLSEREQKAETPKRLYTSVMAEQNNAKKNMATFKLSSDSLRQELKDFVAKYGK